MIFHDRGNPDSLITVFAHTRTPRAYTDDS